MQCKYEELLNLLKKIDLKLLPLKTKVHYQYLEAQYYVAINYTKAARKILSDAIRIAEDMKMETDLNRLKTLLQSLELSTLKK